MTTPLPRDPRLLELLADRALFGLDEHEEAELRALIAADPNLGADLLESSEFDVIVARADAAMSPSLDLPVALRDRLNQAGAQWSGVASAGTHSPAIAGTIRPASAPPSRAWMGWVAAAAALVLAATAWWPRLSGGSRPMPIERQFESFAAAPGAVRAPWAPFNALDNGAPPETSGVTGEVVWNQAEQRGYLKFKGLPANDPAREQYQLWIVDAKRGLDQRISGGVFNAATGETLVPIEPRLHVDQAAVFAVTIERPGGTWVSDMKRRVVLAKLAG